MHINSSLPVKVMTDGSTSMGQSMHARTHLRDDGGDEVVVEVEKVAEVAEEVVVVVVVLLMGVPMVRALSVTTCIRT